MKKTITMPSGNGKGELKLELILDEELGDKCRLYAKVTIPAGSTPGQQVVRATGRASPAEGFQRPCYKINAKIAKFINY